jgi:hypothetical protein
LCAVWRSRGLIQATNDELLFVSLTELLQRGQGPEISKNDYVSKSGRQTQSGIAILGYCARETWGVMPFRWGQRKSLS